MTKEKDFIKRIQDVKFTSENILSKDDVKRLIQEKIERAKRYHQVFKPFEDQSESERD